MQNRELKKKSTRLLECPFCGGDNVSIWECRAFASNNFRYSVNCYDCHFGLGFEETKEQAIELWNTRKPMDRIVERLKEVSFIDWDEKYIDNGECLIYLADAIEIVKDGKDNEK